MTLESSLPYISIAAALAAGVVVGRSRPSSAGPGLKALALAALAMFAYFRGVAPAAIAQALTLTAIASALLPRGPERFGTAGILFTTAGWLVFAYLFLRTGAGHAVLLKQPIRIAALIVLLAGLGWALTRPPRTVPRIRAGALADLGAIGAAAAASLTLPWSAWPAMAGALLVLLGETTLLIDTPPDGPSARRAAWALCYCGQAAMAYAFLR